MIDLKLLNESEPIDLELKKNSGGTSDYNDLSNKPKINGVELLGSLTLEDLGIIINAVKDILINGTSIVSDGVANIPIAKGGVPGLMCVDSYPNQGGLYRANGQTGLIRIQRATPTVIDERKSNYEPIVPSNLDYAVKQAMTDGKGAEWTDEEKANARERLGVTVASISQKNLGLIRLDYARSNREATGLNADSTGLLYVRTAGEDNISNRSGNDTILSVQNMDMALKYAMTDGKGETWTTEEKASARERMGLEWKLLGDVTVEEDGVTKIEIPIDNPNYNEYQVYIYVNRVSNPSSNTLVVNFGDLTTSTYALLNNGVGTKSEVYLRGVIQRHASNGWISWYVSSHDKQVLTAITGRGGQYSESWKTDAPSKINVSLATGLDIGSRFIVYAR